MSIDLLIALIPALPLAGFLFAVLVGPRIDRVPVHGHHADHDADEAHANHDDHGPVDDSGFRGIPTEEEQAATSPHRGHADDLANADGAAGVIPPEFDDGLGQSGHVSPDGPRPRYLSWIVPTGLVGLMWVLSMIVFADVIFGGHEYEVTIYEWISAGDFHVEIGFLVDSLTAMLLLVVSTVGFLVHIYSIGYMDGDRGFWRFFAYLNLFMFSMLVLILADNFLLLYVGWELVGLCSYLLIGFWYKKPSAAGAAKKAFVVNRIGDLGFGLGVIMIWVNLGTLSFREVFERIGTLDEGTITLIALLLFAGAVGKSAQFPLHVWLPDAMEGPTPVSALIHAATMVNAGVYMVARVEPDLRRGADRDAGRGQHRGVHRDLRRRDRADPERHQEGARLFDGQPARLHVPRARHRCVGGGDLPPRRARLLQGPPVHGLRLRDPRRRRRAGHALHGQPARADALDLRHDGHRLAGPLRHPDLRRLLQQGRDPGGGLQPRLLRLLPDRRGRRADDRLLHVPHDLHDLLGRVARAARGVGPRP